MTTNLDVYVEHCQQGASMFLRPFVEFLRDEKGLQISDTCCEEFWSKTGAKTAFISVSNFGGKPVPAAAKPPEKGLCEYIIKKGFRDGERCGKKAQAGKIYCPTHARSVKDAPPASGPVFNSTTPSPTQEEDSLNVEIFDAAKNLYLEPLSKLIVMPDPNEDGSIWAVGKYNEDTKEVIKLTAADKATAIAKGILIPEESVIAGIATEPPKQAPPTKRPASTTETTPMIPPVKKK